MSGVLLLGMAQLLTFGCLSLLQVAPDRFFLLLLLAMHVGILIFVQLKRGLAGKRPEIARIGRATYLMMGLYTPLLIYKLMDRLGVVQLQYAVLHGAALGLFILAVLLAGYTFLALGPSAEG